jgi:transposase
VSIVVAFDKRRVLHVADYRRAESLVPYFQGLTAPERTGIEAIAMDMWEPYRKTVREQVPDGERQIVFDQFHVLQHVGLAVNTGRKAEHRALATEGDATLKGTKYAWLRNPATFTRKAWRAFAVLRESTLQSARAWGIKESRRHL